MLLRSAPQTLDALRYKLRQAGKHPFFSNDAVHYSRDQPMREQTVPKLTLRGAVETPTAALRQGEGARVICAERERGWVGRATNAEVHEAKGKVPH